MDPQTDDQQTVQSPNPQPEKKLSWWQKLFGKKEETVAAPQTPEPQAAQVPQAEPAATIGQEPAVAGQQTEQSSTTVDSAEQTVPNDTNI